MDPPQLMFGYTYHAMMIPPFPPKSALILGYCKGTIAHLMHRIWPMPIVIDAVDLSPVNDRHLCLDENYYVNLLIMDAFKFVQGCGTTYDYVVVDLMRGDKIPPFVFDPNFILHLKRITRRMLAVNCTFYKWDDFAVYDKHFTLDCVKQTNQDKVMFFEPTKVALPKEVLK